MTVRRTQRLPLEELAPYLLQVAKPPAPLDWRTVFGNEQPVEMEVGFGKGLFLVRAAMAAPAVNFLGVEIVRKYQLLTATRLAKRGLRNVRVVQADARWFLRDCIPTDSLQTVHVYYPDPWWKKRHLKRRVFTADFAGQCQRVLRPGGRLGVVTDVEEYFHIIADLVAQQAGLVPVPVPNLQEPVHDLDYLTNFERKFRKAGKPIFRAIYEKRQGAPA